jgi:SAM-dependent methyltransferase
MFDSARLADSSRQRFHYDAIATEYDRHYFDAASLAYRDRFILDPLLRGLDLNNRDIADLACGSGHTTAALLDRFPQAKLTGFDISPVLCNAYQARVHRPAVELDLTVVQDEPPRFDAAIMIGGLHHCAANLAAALRNVATMLRPGGAFLMAEPNRDFWLQHARQIWYRYDHYFDAPTERALCHDELLQTAAADFRCMDVTYSGGAAYFLVFNSLLFRMPLSFKRRVAPPLLALERGWNRLAHGARLSPFFLARWRKHDASSAQGIG